MCLRNMPVPLFPFDTFEAICALNVEDKTFPAAINEIVKKSLTPSARSVLVDLLAFLRDVSKEEEYNKV